VDAILVTSTSEGFGLTALEAAAAGRLCISTPVGYFPQLASSGAGIAAPLDAADYRRFASDTLRNYKDNPAAYKDKCIAIQHAARQFDWEQVIGDWVALLSDL
jgi:glycosyltransferase involved in cell wall biosynthesis